jgi:hypothetical protein
MSWRQALRDCTPDVQESYEPPLYSSHQEVPDMSPTIKVVKETDVHAPLNLSSWSYIIKICATNPYYLFGDFTKHEDTKSSTKLISPLPLFPQPTQCLCYGCASVFVLSALKCL